MRAPQQLITTAFEALARLRHARAFHPRGVVVDGRLLLTDPGSATARALGGPAERPAVVRMSKGAGTPGNLPDLLGIAARVPLDGDRVLDLLFTSVGRGRVTHLLLAPSRGWTSHPYSTFLHYRVDGRAMLLTLDPEEPVRVRGTDPDAVRTAVDGGTVAFALTERPVTGPPRTAGRLVLGPVRTDVRVSFDPVLNAHPRLRPVRPLSGVRRWAYTGSRRGRHADRDALHESP
ncbi:hypothetical protein [Pseudonocardia nigra]|uniref:hypothetical protein n=1 Tax=Pseudonocardia nigra TaxID=1921578 RepID=UPI001C5D6595|nr:hypothetical protein [Pseudonocardia nigra]